jgi:hypothetical protein
MIAGEHIVDGLPRVDDDQAVFWCCSEKDVVARLNVVNPPRCSRYYYAGLEGDGEKTVGGRQDHDPAEGGNYFELVPRLLAESTDDFTILDPSGCVYRPESVTHCGVAG